MVVDFGTYDEHTDALVLHLLKTRDPRKDAPHIAEFVSKRAGDQARVDNLEKMADKVCIETHNCDSNYSHSYDVETPNEREHTLYCQRETCGDLVPKPDDLVQEPPVRPSTNYLPLIGLALVAGLFIYYRRSK